LYTSYTQIDNSSLNILHSHVSFEEQFDESIRLIQIKCRSIDVILLLIAVVTSSKINKKFKF